MPTTASAPVAEAERIEALDLLRGVAVCGILVINIQFFSMPNAAAFNPTAYGDLHGANRWVWRLSHLLAEQKFMTLFSMLFGAGVLLMTGRAETRGASAGPHYRRMAWLLVFGIAHALLVWDGDILMIYALGGMLLYPLRKARARLLLPLALVALALGTTAYAAKASYARMANGEELRGLLSMWKPDEAQVGAELATYRGPWRAGFEARLGQADFLVLEVLLWGLWRAGGNMLLGILMQSLIATTLFYGYGLGLFGRVARAEQLALVAAICLVQLAASSWWMSRHHFGPMEWAWRSLTYGRAQPWRRVRSPGPPLVAA